jgi:hypothetical protein
MRERPLLEPGAVAIILLGLGIIVIVVWMVWIAFS